MSLYGAVLAKVFADRRGLPVEASNRLMVTGYALGSVASPVVAAVVADQLAQREAPPPAAAQPQPQPQPPGGILSEDYRGQQFEQVSKRLTDAGILVRRIDIADPTVPKEAIAQASIPVSAAFGQPFNMPLPAGVLILTGQEVLLAVNTAEQAVMLDNVEGLPVNEARRLLEANGFTVEVQMPQHPERWSEEQRRVLADKVLDQDPEGGQRIATGTTVTLSRFRAADDGIG